MGIQSLTNDYNFMFDQMIHYMRLARSAKKTVDTGRYEMFAEMFEADMKSLAAQINTHEKLQECKFCGEEQFLPTCNGCTYTIKYEA